MSEKVRQIDDVVRGIAAIICAAVVGIWLAINFIAFIVVKSGGPPVDLKDFNLSFHDFILIIISASAGVAFGRRGGVNTEQSSNVTVKE